MKTKVKPERVYRGIYLPKETDAKLREISVRDKRSVTRTAEILLESALKRQITAANAGGVTA